MRLCSKAVVAAIVLVALASAPTVEAQSTSKPTEAPQPAGWLFTPTLGFGAAWDNNVLLLNPGSNPPEDYGAPLSGDLSLDYRGRKLSFQSAYAGSFVFYRTLDELNSADHRAGFMLEHRATSRLTLIVLESFIQSPTTDGLKLEGVPFSRIGSRTNEAGAGLEAVVARHTTLTGGYMLRSVTFDERLGQPLQDGHEHEWKLALTREISPRLTIGGEYELRQEVLSDGLDRFNAQSAGVTVEYGLTRALLVSGLIGLATLGDGLTHDAETGPAVEAGLAYRAKNTRLTAHYQRTFVPSFGFGGTFQNEEWLANAYVPIVFISPRLYSDTSAVWQDNDPVVVGQPSLQTLQLSTALGYRASRWATLEVFVSRTQQDTQRPGGDLRRTEAGFRILVMKPMRIR